MKKGIGICLDVFWVGRVERMQVAGCPGSIVRQFGIVAPERIQQHLGAFLAIEIMVTVTAFAQQM